MLRFIHTRFHLGVSSCSHPPFSLIISHGGATIVRRPPPVTKPNQTNPQPKKKKTRRVGFFGMTLLYSSPDPSFCFVVVVVVMGSVGCLVGLLGEEVLLEQDAELLAEGLELLEVLLVLALVLDLGFDACVGGSVFLCGVVGGMVWHTLKDADGGGVVVDTSCGAESGREDRGGGDQVVGEGVVQVTLGGGVRVSFVVEVGGRGGDVIPGARKHPGRCRIPSRTCPRAMPVRDLVSSFLMGVPVVQGRERIC